MKRREFLRAGLRPRSARPVLAAPAIAQSAPEIKWRLTSSFPKTARRSSSARRRSLCRYIAEATDNKFQIQPFTAGELAPSRQALDAVSSGSVECAHTPTLLLRRQGPDARLRHRPSVRPQCSRHQQSWWTFGGGAEIVNASLKKLNAVRHSGRLHRRADGRLVQEGDRHASTISRACACASAALGGPVLARVGVVPQQIPHVDVYAALEQRHHRCRRVHLPARRREARPAKVAKYNHYPVLVGKRRHAAYGRQSREVERAAQVLPGDRRAGLRRGERMDARQVRCGQSAGAQAAGRRRRRAEAIPAAGHGGCYKAANEHYAELAAKDPHFRKALDSVNAFRKEQLRLVADRRACLRQLHDHRRAAGCERDRLIWRR